MEPLPFPPNLQALLAELHSWGAVIEHVLFTAPSAPDEEAHEQAARSALKLIVQETRRQVPLWTALHADVSKITRDRAQRQSVQQFFGPCYEVETDSVILRGQTSDFLNDYFREGTEETKANARKLLQADWSLDLDAATVGYAHALFEPPYPLSKLTNSSYSRLTNLELAAAFRRLLDALFGELAALETYVWPTDCSNYFDAGHEWWGSFFWTVYSPSKNWLVTIIASTTD